MSRRARDRAAASPEPKPVPGVYLVELRSGERFTMPAASLSAVEDAIRGQRFRWIRPATTADVDVPRRGPHGGA